MSNWWDIFSWGYATDIEEQDEESDDEKEVVINITIDLGEENGNS